MSEFVTVAHVDELRAGQVEVFEVDEEFVAVANVDGQFCAFADVCTHDGGPLVEGELESRVITCPRHGAQFDVCSGAVLKLPAVTALPTFEVRVIDGEVQVKVV